jgi:SAM-dependent methyltransferase
MNILRKARTAFKVFREDGPSSVFSILKSKYRPLSAKSKWKKGIKSEIGFWDDFFRTKGLKWPDDYFARFNPDLPLQARVVGLLPMDQSEVNILDVGAGPLTFLGKKCQGKQINITAVDPLAEEYTRILEKYKIKPIIRTQRLEAEELTKRFQSNTYDLVFAKNCLDHSYDPEKAILQMIDVVKSGRYVLLEHIPSAAERAKYSGLHQWNFSLSTDGDFLINSAFTEINMTRKYAALCKMESELVKEDEDWLIVRIHKRLQAD